MDPLSEILIPNSAKKAYDRPRLLQPLFSANTPPRKRFFCNWRIISKAFKWIWGVFVAPARQSSTSIFNYLGAYVITKERIDRKRKKKGGRRPKTSDDVTDPDTDSDRERAKKISKRKRDRLSTRFRPRAQGRILAAQKSLRVRNFSRQK